MLLKMRGTSPKIAADPITGVLLPTSGENSDATEWFQSIQLTRKLLCHAYTPSMISG